MITIRNTTIVSRFVPRNHRRENPRSNRQQRSERYKDEGTYLEDRRSPLY